MNRPSRSRCDCGFELRPTDDQIRRTLATQSDKRVMQMVIGAAAIAAGAGFSYLTHVGAVKGGGGGYVVFTGVIIYGFIRVIWGYRGLREVRAWQRRVDKRA